MRSYSGVTVHIVIIDREPAGLSLAGKLTNFHVYSNIPYTWLYKETGVWQADSGGCGQGGMIKKP